MRDFSLDLESEKIYDIFTKEHFKEVLSSYHNENYRSAIVMLNSVVIVDLVYKLQYLLEYHNDSTSKKIIEKVEKSIEEKPDTSDWEKILINEINKEKILFEPFVHENILHLVKTRNHCAHPILDKKNKLYTPNKDSVRALIRNMLEGVLCKHPIVSKKNIIEEIVSFVADSKFLYTSNENFLKHVKLTYLEKIPTEIEIELFKTLYKFIFKIDNQDTQENKEINLLVLNFIIERHYDAVIKNIEENQQYYGKFIDCNVRDLIIFLNNYPKIYLSLNQEAQNKLRIIIDRSMNFSYMATFLFKNSVDHYDFLKSDAFKNKDFAHIEINLESIKILYCKLTKEDTRLANKLIITHFTESKNFNDADFRYKHIIRPKLNIFDKIDYQILIDGIEKNNQIYGRKESKDSNTEIECHILKKFENSFDFSNYTNFSNSLKK